MVTVIIKQNKSHHKESREAAAADYIGWGERTKS